MSTAHPGAAGLAELEPAAVQEVRTPHPAGGRSRRAEKMSQTAMNIAAITGPTMNPLSPNTAIPPKVETSTT